MKTWVKRLLIACLASMSLLLLVLAVLAGVMLAPPRLRDVRVEVRPALYFYTEEDLAYHREYYPHIFAGQPPPIGDPADYIVFSVHATHRGSADALQHVWIDTPQPTRLRWAYYNTVKYTGGNENWIATVTIYAAGLSETELEQYIRALTLRMTTSFTRHGATRSTTFSHHIDLSLNDSTFVHE